MERHSKQDNTESWVEYLAKGHDDSGRKFIIDKTFAAVTNQ